MLATIHEFSKFRPADSAEAPEGRPYLGLLEIDRWAMLFRHGDSWGQTRSPRAFVDLRPPVVVPARCRESSPIAGPPDSTSTGPRTVAVADSPARLKTLVRSESTPVGSSDVARAVAQMHADFGSRAAISSTAQPAVLRSARTARHAPGEGRGSGAEERTRTFTRLPGLAPEASASANSATSAQKGRTRGQDLYL